MAEGSPTQPYVDAINNIKDTTKWLVASLGAVLAVMLGGIQLNALGFAEASAASVSLWAALAATILAVVVALYLAVAVLVSEGISLSRLKTDPALEAARAFINKEWSHLSSTTRDPFGDLVQDFEALGTKSTKQGLTKAEEQELADAKAHVEVAVYIARWQQVLRRFKRLRNAMLFLVPVVSVASVVMAAAAKPEGENGTELDPPVVVALPATTDNVQTLTTAGWGAACMSASAVPVLLYKEYAAGVSLAATTQATTQCQQLRLVLLDRVRIVKVL
jgi:hypothetical protein